MTSKIVDSRLGDADYGDVGGYLVAIVVTISAIMNLTILLIFIFISTIYFKTCVILVCIVICGGVVHEVGPIDSGEQHTEMGEEDVEVREENSLRVGTAAARGPGTRQVGCWVSKEAG